LTPKIHHLFLQLYKGISLNELSKTKQVVETGAV